MQLKVIQYCWEGFISCILSLRCLLDLQVDMSSRQLDTFVWRSEERYKSCQLSHGIWSYGIGEVSVEKKKGVQGLSLGVLHHLEEDWRKETEPEQQVRQEGNQKRGWYPGIQVRKAYQEGMAINCVICYWEHKDEDYELTAGFGNIDFRGLMGTKTWLECVQREWGKVVERVNWDTLE